jgi:hypothetical protein
MPGDSIVDGLELGYWNSRAIAGLGVLKEGLAVIGGGLAVAGTAMEVEAYVACLPP